LACSLRPSDSEGMALGSEDTTWICPTPDDRDRALEMQKRFKPVRFLSFAFMAAALAASIPWLGIWPLPLLGIVLLLFVVLDRALPRARRPEYVLAGAWAVAALMVGASCVLSGNVNSPVMPWFAIAAVTLPARFRGVVAAVGAVLLVVAMLVISFAGNAGAVLHNPTPLFMNIALVGSIVAFSLALMRSDLDHRSEAFLDSLTGMLNRHALDRRTAELTAQAQMNRQPISLILADVDHFKTVNDEHGHETGDAVLTEIARRMRGALRAYDLAYRLGGDEFLILVPGADLTAATEIATTVRRAISSEPVAEVNVTMSVGVGTYSAGRFDYEKLFAEADEALYRAKRQGRNRVAACGDLGALSRDISAAWRSEDREHARAPLRRRLRLKPRSLA
jgi:diguanylate cyclase (GGDEF)-like protein